MLTAYEDTKLLGYKWVNDTVEIKIGDGAVYYMTYYVMESGRITTLEKLAM